MKAFIAFALLIASVAAVPKPLKSGDFEAAVRQGEPRFVTNAIEDAIENLAEQIVEAGLDPLFLPYFEERYELPVPTVFNSKVSGRIVTSQGGSDIAINSMSYAAITSRLRFDISLPRVAVQAESIDAEANGLGASIAAHVSGSIAITQPRIVGDIRVNVGVISGISIRSLDLDFSLAGIQADLNLNIAGYDISDWTNNLLNNWIPNALSEFRSDINELLEIVVLQVIEENLNN